jgi:hypothetical protein
LALDDPECLECQSLEPCSALRRQYVVNVMNGMGNQRGQPQGREGSGEVGSMYVFRGEAKGERQRACGRCTVRTTEEYPWLGFGVVGRGAQAVPSDAAGVGRHSEQTKMYKAVRSSGHRAEGGIRTDVVCTVGAGHPGARVACVAKKDHPLDARVKPRTGPWGLVQGLVWRSPAVDGTSQDAPASQEARKRCVWRHKH